MIYQDFSLFYWFFFTLVFFVCLFLFLYILFSLGKIWNNSIWQKNCSRFLDLIQMKTVIGILIFLVIICFLVSEVMGKVLTLRINYAWRSNQRLPYLVLILQLLTPLYLTNSNFIICLTLTYSTIFIYIPTWILFYFSSNTTVTVTAK